MNTLRYWALLVAMRLLRFAAQGREWAVRFGR